MKISDIMTSLPTSVTVNDSVRNAKRVMAELQIRHLPVVDAENSLVGIVTDRDIKMHQAISGDPTFHETAVVASVLKANPYAVPPATPARDVVRYMVDNHIGSALIVEDGKLLGIFTAMDACRVLAECLE